MTFDSERIDIAIDPFTGRNPSYCFVDLQTKEHAERAMVELDGHDMLGRPVKIKPGVAKSAERAAEQTRTPFAISRWRPSEGSATSNTTSFAKVNNNDSSQRVYVGGLPRLTEPESVQSNMRTFFQGYNVYVASRRISRMKTALSHFCNSVCPFRY
jgi:RNA recognition motif-containing protein